MPARRQSAHDLTLSLPINPPPGRRRFSSTLTVVRNRSASSGPPPSPSPPPGRHRYVIAETVLHAAARDEYVRVAYMHTSTVRPWSLWSIVSAPHPHTFKARARVARLAGRKHDVSFPDARRRETVPAEPIPAGGRSDWRFPGGTRSGRGHRQSCGPNNVANVVDFFAPRRLALLNLWWGGVFVFGVASEIRRGSPTN